MPTAYKNRLVCTVSAVAAAGLGAFTVSTAQSGYVTFAAGDDGLSFDVVAVEGTAWEVRTGCVYTHSGTSLARGTLESSSTGSAIALTSAAVLTVTPSAAKFATVELAMQAVIPGGRLTLQSGVPVSTTDQTAKTSVYYTPFVHNIVPLWDGTNWKPVVFAETTLVLGTITSAKNYDVFGYLSSGSLALEMLAWTSDTARATAVTLQDGRYCKSGDKTRLLLGTFYTTSTTTTEDSASNRYVCNVYNTVQRLSSMSVSGTYTHTYTTGAWREWNGGTGVTRIQFVVSTVRDAQIATHLANLSGATSLHGYTNLQIDGTDGSTKLTGTNIGGYGSNIVPTVSAIASSVAVGKHYLTIIEYGNIGTTYYSTDAQLGVTC